MLYPSNALSILNIVKHRTKNITCLVCDVKERVRAWHYTDTDTTFQHYAPLHSGRRCPARPDGDIRPEAILSTSFGSSHTATHRQVTCTCQIWISGWILPHFDVRTISVASKLKKLQIFFDNEISWVTSLILDSVVKTVSVITQI